MRRRQRNRKGTGFRGEACEGPPSDARVLPWAMDMVIRGGVSHRLARDVFYRREASGSAILADAAFAVAKDHIHRPGQAVFHRPMIADTPAA